MALKSVSKAIASAVSGAIVAYAASKGFDIPADAAGWLEAAITTGLGALFGYVVAYFAPKNEPA